MNAKNGTIYIVLTALAFGTMEIALKIAGSSFTAFQLTFLRFFIGGLLLLPLAVKDLMQQACASDKIGLDLCGHSGDNQRYAQHGAVPDRG